MRPGQGWLREGIEGGAQEEQSPLRHEGNVEGCVSNVSDQCSIITKKSVPSVMNERNLLAQLKHPFLVNMVYAFQDR